MPASLKPFVKLLDKDDKPVISLDELIEFCNGYATQAPEMLVEFCGLRRYGKGRDAYYAILLGRIVKIKRWNP